MGCNGSRTVSLTTQTTTLQQNYALTNADILAPYKLFTKILEKANKAKIKLHAAIQPSTTLKLVDIRLAFNLGRSMLTEHWFECAKIVDANAVTFPEFLYLCTLIALCDCKQLVTFVFYSFPLNKENNLILLTNFIVAIRTLQDSFTEIPLPIDVFHQQLKQIAMVVPAPTSAPTSTPAVTTATNAATPLIARTDSGVCGAPSSSSSLSSCQPIANTPDDQLHSAEDTLMVSLENFQQLVNTHTSLYTLCTTFQDNIAQKSRTKAEWLNTRQHLLKISPNVLAELTDLMKLKNYNVVEIIDTHHECHSRKASQVPSARRRKATEYFESLHETIATELHATKKLTQIEDPNNIFINSNLPPTQKNSTNNNNHSSNLQKHTSSSKVAPLQLKRMPSSNGDVKSSLAQLLRTDRSARRAYNNNNTTREASRLVNKASTLNRRQMSMYALPTQISSTHSPRASSLTKSRSKQLATNIGTALIAANTADEKIPKVAQSKPK